jgi:GNAT superfamily N-acetyltransferase
MYWRIPHSQFGKNTGRDNKRAFKRIVESGQITGILAYNDGAPIGWCSIAPRETYTALERSRMLKRIDDQPVWSVVCFFMAKEFRRQGLMTELLRAAVAYARENGAKIVEGYPSQPTKSLTGSSGYMGIVSAFRQAGFVKVRGGAGTRPVMRYLIGE